MSSLWFETALLPQGWAAGVRIGIAEGRISAIETGVAPSGDDERHAIGLPGLCNLHSHAFQRGMAGLAETGSREADDFWSWRALMYRFVERITPDQIAAIAAQAYAEMLESGFTRVAEFHYLHHRADGGRYDDIAEHAGRIVEAADETGIGLTLLPVFYAHGGFGAAPPGAAQRRFVTGQDAFAALMQASRRAVAPLEDGVLGLAPHSLRAAEAREIAALLPLAEGGPVHIHVAEQNREVADCLAWCGRRPVEHLFDTLPIDARWCLIHATHMTGAETALLAGSGAVAGLCPITEANLGDGIFAARDYAAHGGRFGVGSDSNVLIDAAGELRQLEYSQRLALRARNVLADPPARSTGRRLFDAAAIGGAQACGVPPSAIAVGQAADLVGLVGEDVGLAGRQGDALLDAWIFSARRGLVDTVWRRGVRCVTDGRHHRRSAIAARYRAALSALLA